MYSDASQTQLVEVLGRMAGNNSLALAQALDNALASGCTTVILDLGGVEYINSAGLRELMLLYKRMQHTGGQLKIANPSDRVQKLLELVGLDSVIDIYFDPSLKVPHHPNAAAFAATREICYCS
jgi:anti-sigma B factor antagonist